MNVGRVPSSIYHLSYDKQSPNLNRYWPSSTLGIGPKGSFFECSSGKMLHFGGKAYLDQDYYLLQKGSCLSVPTGISCERLTKGRHTIWNLYEIHVDDFSASVARFFLERSVFLTEKPVKFYPVWPPYIEDSYFLYHKEYETYFFMHGVDTEVEIYPSFMPPRYDNFEKNKLYKICLPSKEQLVSLGQFGAIDFFYLMKKELNMVAPLPEIQVKDIYGISLKQDIFDRLPKGSQIVIQASFDGKFKVFRKGRILEIRRLSADQYISVDISYGSEIQIFQGCDLIRTIQFVKTKFDHDYTKEERLLLNRLRNCKGLMMPVSHDIGAWIKQLSHFPLLRQWLYQVVRRGEIHSDAMRLLRFSNVLNRGEKDER